MLRRTLLTLALCALAGLAGWRLRPSAPPARAQEAGRAGRAGGGAVTLAAEGYTVEPTTVRETVPSLGSLRANEAVTIVAESSLRVVAVHFTEGALVRKGHLLFKLDDAHLKAELLRLQGRHALALATEARQAELLAQKLVSQQEYDRARSELQAIQGELEVLKVELDQTEIRAPFAGRVGLRRVSEGAYVSPSTPLTTLQDVSQLKLDFALPERYAGHVRPGQAFTFRVEGRGETYTGRVQAVEPAIETATRSVLVRGLVPNPGGRLTPGASASVEFEVRSESGIMIPTRALVPSISGHSVFVYRDGKAASQDVTIGVRTADRVQIVSGLRPGDVVLTSNLLRLRPGIGVRLDAPAD
jgi:membrane fusion protein (multidrug efflux system)